MTDRWCIPLAEATDITLAGGKAASLARLRAHGFLVPDGFCITTEVFSTVCAASGIAPDAQPSPAAFTIPDPITSAIVESYHQLGTSAVAVRSSALAEDLGSASFAGQYETVLDVEGDAALLVAVRRCWTSAFAGRARAYADAEHIDQGGGMAVLVQRMVPAASAGVVFTQSPLPGRDDELVIEAAPGLGEAVVSARVTPDRYSVRRSDLTAREVVVSPDRGPSARPVLNAAEVRRLAETALRVERIAGSPQDIEWAAIPGDLYLLQARAITTLVRPDAASTAMQDTPASPSSPDIETAPLLPPVAEASPSLDVPSPGPETRMTGPKPLQPVPKGKPHDLWSRANTGEVFPGVISPLTWSAIEAGFRDFTAGAARRLGVPADEVGDVFGVFYGRVYTNVGVMHHLMTEVLGFSSNYFEGSLGGPGRIEGLPLPRQSVRWSKVAKFVPLILEDLRSSGDLQARADAIMEDARAMDARLRTRDLKSMSLEELRGMTREIAETTGPGWVFHTQCAGAAFGAYGMLGGALRRWAGDRMLANDLLTGLTTLSTTDISEELWRVARRAATDPETARRVAAADVDALPDVLQQTEAGRAAWAGLRSFLDRYGHRCHDELDVMTPRWADDPRPIFGVFKGYVAAGPEHDPTTFEERQRQKRIAAERAIDLKLSQGIERWLPARRRIFHILLDRARDLMPLRENIKHELLRLTLHLRRALLETGRRLTEQGALGAADDVFFAEVGEIEAMIANPRIAPVVRRRITQRKRLRESYLAIEPPDIIVPGVTPAPEPKATSQAAAPAGAVLTGLGASGGRASGRARVLHSPADAGQMQPGEILVAPFTDPGWTPVFPLAAGIVMDLGGLLSHGAIVAREFGIPAVVNVRDGTTRIRTGQMVTVDGGRGLVLLDDGE